MKTPKKILFGESSNISPGAAEHPLGDAIDFRGNSFEPVFKHSVLILIHS